MAGAYSVNRATYELFVSEVTGEGARGCTVIAVTNLHACILQIRGGVTFVFPTRWNMRLMSQPRKIVSKTLPHILYRVDLNILDPVIILVLRIQPKREPVGIRISMNLIIKINLCHPIISQIKITLPIGMLKNASFTVHCLSRDGCGHRMTILSHIRSLQKLRSKPVTSTRSTLIPIPFGIKNLIWLNRVPLLPIILTPISRTI